MEKSSNEKEESGKLHQYKHGLVAFEFAGLKSASQDLDRPLVLFIGGLGDGLLTVPYVGPLARSLDNIGWGVVQVLTQSSYTGWGVGNLDRDDEDLHAAVEYFRNLGRHESSKQHYQHHHKELDEDKDNHHHARHRKIILMGHSTGSQNVMYYLSKSPRDNYLVAGIAQAPVSDREAVYNLIGKERTEEILDKADKIISQGRPNDTLPAADVEFFSRGTPISATRWVDLVAKHGMDDFFSSDLTSADFANSFGNIKPIIAHTSPSSSATSSNPGTPNPCAHSHSKLVLIMSENDEFVPTNIDKKKLLDRFRNAIRPRSSNSPSSGIIPGASHNVGPELSSSESQDWLVERVADFIVSL